MTESNDRDDADEQPLEYWVSQLQAPTREERGIAAIHLGERGIDGLPALPALLDAIRAETDMAGAAVLNIVQGAEAAPAIPRLLKALDDDFPVVRWYAVRALAQVGPAAVPALEAIGPDANPILREGVAQTLRAIREPESLTEGTGDTHAEVEDEAAPAWPDVDVETEEWDVPRYQPGEPEEPEETSPPGLLAMLPDHGSEVHALAFGADSRTLLVAAAGVVRWDLEAGEGQRILGPFPIWLHVAAVAPDLRYLAAGTVDGTVTLYDLEERVSRPFFGAEPLLEERRPQSEAERDRLLAEALAHTSLSALLFSPDGRTLASCGALFDPTQGMTGGAKVWDVVTGQALQTLVADQSIETAAFYRDGQRLVTVGAREGMKEWDLASGLRLVSGLPRRGFSRVYTVALSPDGGNLAVPGHAEVAVWDVASGTQRLTLLGHPSSVNTVVYSPDGTLLASAGLDPVVRLYDAATGQTVAVARGHDRYVWSLAFSPDGKFLAAGDNGGNVRVWEVEQLLATPPELAADAYVAAAMTLFTAAQAAGQQVPDKVIQRCSDALQLNPDNRVAHAARGWAHFLRGENEQALDDLNAAVRLGLEDVETYLMRAEVLTDLGRWEDAAADATSALRIQPGLPMAHLRRGEAYLRGGAWQQALAEADEVVRSAPQHPKGYYLRAQAQADGDAAEAALEDLEAVLQLDPENVEAHFLRGRLLARQGDQAGASAAFLQSLRGHRDHAEAWFRLGLSEAAQGEWRRAAAAYGRALRCDRQTGARSHPMHQRRAVLVRYHRALTWIQLGRLDHAIVDLTAAARLHPHHAPLYIVRAAVFFGLREYDRAAADCRRAARLDSRWSFLRAARADAPKEMSGALAATVEAQDFTAALRAVLAQSPALVPDPSEQLQHLEGHTAPVTCVAFAPDGRLAFSASEDGTVRVWEIPGGRLLHQWEGPGHALRALAVSANGRLLATGGDGPLVSLWDVALGREIGRWPVADDGVVGLAFCHDDRRLLAAGSGGTLSLWEIPTGQPRQAPLQTDGSFTSLAVAPDGSLALVAGGVEGVGGYVCVLDLDRWEWLGGLSGDSPHRDWVRAVAFGPDAPRAFSAGGGERDVWGDMIDCDPRCWDLEYDRRLRTFRRRHRDAVLALAVSPSGRRLVSAGRDGGLQFWDAASGRPVRRVGGETVFRCVAFSPDGRFLVSGGEDYRVWVWGTEG